MGKLLLVIDVQNEYVTDGRAFNIKSIQPSLQNIKKILNEARKNDIPVWHMRHEQEKNVFIKGSQLADYVDDFRPIDGEKSFTKSMYSCFSSDEYTSAMAELKPEEVIIVGYGTSMCCTCTIIDGIHRGYKFSLVEDATASRAFPHATEEEMHRSAVNILTQYASIKLTNDLVQEFQKRSLLRV